MRCGSWLGGMFWGGTVDFENRSSEISDDEEKRYVGSRRCSYVGF